MEELTRKYQTLFRAGAIFNGLVSAAMMAPQSFFPLLQITPIPDEPSIYLHLSSFAIGCFGLAYFWASQDFPQNSNLIELGIIGKIGVNVLAVVHVFFFKTISWQLFLVTVWDLIFAALFTRALLDLYEHQKAKQQ